MIRHLFTALLFLTPATAFAMAPAPNPDPAAVAALNARVPGDLVKYRDPVVAAHAKATNLTARAEAEYSSYLESFGNLSRTAATGRVESYNAAIRTIALQKVATCSAIGGC